MRIAMTFFAFLGHEANDVLAKHQAEIPNLKAALRKALSILEHFPMSKQDIRIVWRKEKVGSWQIRTETHPDLTPIFIKGPVDWDLLAAETTQAFRQHHPEYLGPVGTPAGTLPMHPSNLIQIMIGHLWRRHSTWLLDDGIIDGLLDELAHFIDDPIIPVTFVAQLLNFHPEPVVEQIALPRGLIIRPLSEDEFSEIYGVSSLIEAITFLPRPRFMHEYAIAGEYQMRKLVNEPLPQSVPYADLHDILSRAVLALRTFKKGRVGYEIVNLRPKFFCPYLFQTRVGGSEYVPMGFYQLSTEEIRAFQNHAELVFADLHPSLEVACSRLGDAETRLKPRDGILDAVIGLEAILLAQIGKEQYRGEMRYRFALNYSSLFNTPDERHRGFLVARALYDLRSRIAHGGRVSDEESIAKEKLTLYQISEKACEILRSIIRKFLSGGCSPEYVSVGFWEKAHFGIGGP